MYRWPLVILITLVLCGIISGQSPGFVVTGHMTATDQESREGTFHVGTEFMVITKPKSPIHDDLMDMVGHDVTVIIEAR